MPLIKPNATESRPQFMSRCMGDDKMRSEFPENTQRFAVCSNQFAGKDDSMDIDEKFELDEDYNGSFYIPCDIKAYHDDDDDDDKKPYGKFEGYGSIFGNKDLGNDVVMEGAFSKSLRSRRAKGVKLLWQHKQDMPIGVFESIKEDGDGLRVKGSLALGTQQGREAYELLKMGALDGLSIGYKADPKKQGYDERRRRRMLKEVDLMEISLVTFPMNPKARVSAVKGLDGKDAITGTIRDWEDHLREVCGLSRSLSKVCAKALVDTISKQRDAGDDLEIRDAIESMKGLMAKFK